MQKRNMIAIGSGVVILAAIGGIFLTMNHTPAIPHSWKNAKATQATVICLAANPRLNIPENERSGIEMMALTYLADVPAGTNVDVKLATYSFTKVTGTDYYPAKYGTYNFAMAKQGDGWHFTDFKRCR